MLSEGIHMGLTMSEKKALTRQTAARYRKSGKKQKGKILDEFVAATGYTRKYAGWILRNVGKKRIVYLNGELVELVVGQPRKKRRKPREKIYDEQVFKALKKIWAIFDCICGKRLVVVLRTMLPVLEKFGEIDLNEEMAGKLQRISAATIDRLLAKEKKDLTIKGRGHTKPGTLLKHQIPIRTFSGWDEAKPGFVELDLVGHEGGNGQGEFCFTLNLTDVDTGWTEPRAVKNKAQKWTFEALMHIKQRLPFDLLGIDSDNGGEFINFHLYDYCNKNNIEFTRSRANRKNDNCFVEQKNNSVVRRYVGYFRYDTDEQLHILNEIYDQVRLLVNFFHPSMKLVSKTREGAKVRRRYDVPKTPHQRLMQSPNIPQTVKDQLTAQFDELNPAAITREILRLQEKLQKETLRISRAAGVLVE
jgi:hypothetical protein